MNIAISTPDASELPRNCTFDSSDWRILAQHWYPVSLIRDVEERGLVGATLLDEKLLIYKVGEVVVVADDICTHRGVALTMGANDDYKGVCCPYHGLQFGRDGKCIKVPAHPGCRCVGDDFPKP